MGKEHLLPRLEPRPLVDRVSVSGGLGDEEVGGQVQHAQPDQGNALI